LKPATDKKQQLNPKQKSFVLQYLIDKNATQAAIRAGYSSKNAHVVGPRLFANVRIQQEIVNQIALQEKRTLVTADEVITELKRIAFLDISGALKEDGSLKDISEIPEDIRHAIAGLEIEELFEGTGREREHVGFTKKIKLSDKVRALELIGKHLKLFTEKIEHSGEINGKQDVTHTLAEGTFENLANAFVKAAAEVSK
jgi:phage terminase small subunit